MSGCSVLAQGFLLDFETNSFFLYFFSSDGSYHKNIPQIFYSIVPPRESVCDLKDTDQTNMKVSFGSSDSAFPKSGPGCSKNG